jgi:hypothetical protein
MMRLGAATALAVAFIAVSASAQDQSVVVVPPAPPVVSSPPSTPGQAPASPAAAQPAPAPSPVTPDLAPTPPNTWVPGKQAILGVLDKVDGSVSQLIVPVGGQMAAGDLVVSVQACMTRPPGQIPDTAAFLTVQAANQPAAAPLFRGWMVRSVPGATIVANAAETFRIIGCS